MRAGPNMKTQIVLLRGINVGGRQLVGMNELKKWLVRQGTHDVRTYLQSGNVVLRSPTPPEKLEDKLSAQFQKDFGQKVEFFARWPELWDGWIGANPFRA